MPAAKKPRVNRGNAGKGRPKGAMNKATREIKEITQPHTAAAIATLLSIMRNVKAAAAARTHSAEILLAYAHGRPRQAVDLAATINVKDEREIIDDVARIFGVPATGGSADEPGSGRPVLRSQIN